MDPARTNLGSAYHGEEWQTRPFPTRFRGGIVPGDGLVLEGGKYMSPEALPASRGSDSHFYVPTWKFGREKVMSRKKCSINDKTSRALCPMALVRGLTLHMPDSWSRACTQLNIIPSFPCRL